MIEEQDGQDGGAQDVREDEVEDATAGMDDGTSSPAMADDESDDGATGDAEDDVAGDDDMERPTAEDA